MNCASLFIQTLKISYFLFSLDQSYEQKLKIGIDLISSAGTATNLHLQFTIIGNKYFTRLLWRTARYIIVFSSDIFTFTHRHATNHVSNLAVRINHKLLSDWNKSRSRKHHTLTLLSSQLCIQSSSVMIWPHAIKIK